ncbi:MAG TPA: Gfo/Idh/MocA family oxidoreductase [Longimicrobiales bacterium]
MDYTTQRLGFKLRKAARYVVLYGVRRTLVKIRGQYHMKKRYKSLPVVAPVPPDGGHVGLIGCGNFAFSNIAYYVQKNYGPVMRGAMDIDVHRAASMYEQYGFRYFTDDADRIIADPQIDLIYIASNHASHAEYAINALRAGKSVHIEKPHVVTEDQLKRLCATMVETRGKVNLGFNRPYSRIGLTIKHFLESQPGPAMFNWFVAGHEIAPDHWYFRHEEGGRVLGNLCHWTDFVLQLVAPENRYPLTITPTRAEKSDCDIAVTYTFADGSIAAITFSAKGHTFEGVRERFSAHRGNVLISMDDFKYLKVEVVEKRHRIAPLFRDHGHERTIVRSYEMVRPRRGQPIDACSVEYVWETGNLFLKTREALQSRRPIVIHAYKDRSHTSSATTLSSV